MRTMENMEDLEKLREKEFAKKVARIQNTISLFRKVVCMLAMIVAVFIFFYVRKDYNNYAGSQLVMAEVINVEGADDSVNLRSPSLSVSESGNEELCSELSPDMDVISGSPYTSSNLKTDGQPKVGRGLPSIDDSSAGSSVCSTCIASGSACGSIGGSSISHTEPPEISGRSSGDSVKSGRSSSDGASFISIGPSSSSDG